MAVVATAGHVDHGKSALVRRLTGLEPDRLVAERARGLTLDLGHTHLPLPSGRTLGIVDVPGHERYLGTTVSGIGPAGGVVFCVASDEGWSAQSEQHARACAALGLDGARLVLVMTKTDRRPEPAATSHAVEHLVRLGLRPRAVVHTSARTGAGIADLVDVLDDLADDLTEGPSARHGARLWVDRSFTLPGTGTIVTGTLSRGTFRRGDMVHTAAGMSRVRRLQRYGDDLDEVAGPDRVALNLARRSVDEVPRGTAVVAEQDPALSDRFDTESVARFESGRWPRSTLLSFGTATVSGRLSPTPTGIRLTLPRAQPLRADDRVLVRDPGGRTVLGGLRVVAPLRHRRRTTDPGRSSPRAVGLRAPRPPGVIALLAHLEQHPLEPPDRARLVGWGVTGADLRALSVDGEITYAGGGVAFGVDAVAVLLRTLEGVAEPFSVSDVRRALGLSRAHTLALLAVTDRTGLTRRLPSGDRLLGSDSAISPRTDPSVG